MELLVQDVRYALVIMRRNKAFTAAALVTLALGIGATTAVFSVVYGVLLRPLPFPAGDRLVRIIQVLPSRNGRPPSRAGLSPGQIAEWSATSHSFADIGSYGHSSHCLQGVPTPVRLNGAGVSVGLLRATGVTPIAGRMFTDDDAIPGNEHVVLLEYATWKRRFGGAADLIERSIFFDGTPYRVIGI